MNDNVALATSTPVRSSVPPTNAQTPAGYLLTVHEAAEPEFDPLKEDERLAMRLMAAFQEEELQYQRLVEEDRRFADRLSSEENLAADHQRMETQRIVAEDRRLAEIAAAAEIATNRDEEVVQLSTDEQLARLLAESSTNSNVNYAPGDYSAGVPLEATPHLSYPEHPTTQMQILEDERLAWELAESDNELPPAYIRPEGVPPLAFPQDSPPTYMRPAERSGCETSTPNTVFNPMFEDSCEDSDLDRARSVECSAEQAAESMRMVSGRGHNQGETPGPVVMDRLLGNGVLARSMAKMIC